MRLPPLHGRDPLLLDVRARLAAGERVTLVGPRGVGKTRIAQALLAERTGRFVALHGVSAVDGVERALGRALLPPRPPLLVLDGSERLAPASVAWLDAAIPESWAVLVTSRCALGWHPERCLEVPVLDASSARRVFVDAAVRPLPAANLDRVVARLGRLPGPLRVAATCLDLVDLPGLERCLGDPEDEVWVEARFERLASLRKLVLRHFPDGEWRIHSGGAWHEPPTSPRQTIKGAANRRMLAHLVELRLSSPGAHASRRDLARAGWPNEQLPAKSAGNRVRVALSTLRSAGLFDLIERGEDGWRLTPSREVSRVA